MGLRFQANDNKDDLSSGHQASGKCASTDPHENYMFPFPSVVHLNDLMFLLLQTCSDIRLRRNV